MTARIWLVSLLMVSAAWARDGKSRVPGPAVPQRYGQTAEGTTVDAAELARWWSGFHDAELDSLVERAIHRNTDLRLAAERTAEARAFARLERSALLPSIGSNTSFDRIRGGFNQGIVHIPNSGGATSGGSLVSPFDTNSFQSGFDASWELDFFGGNRKALAAARADYRAAEEARRDALVTVIAEVARNYMELRGLDRRLEITRRNIQTQSQTLDLTRTRAEAGLGTELDVAQQGTQLATTQAAEPMLESARIRAVQRLGVLLGEPPETLVAELRKAAALPSAPPVIPIGFPSDLLTRRPDLRRAAAEVDGAGLRVGVARAELFPKFVISGLTGRQSTDLGGFTLGAGNFFSVGPGIQLPLFTGGRIRANIAAQDARLDQAATRYEGAMLAALEDVESALAAYGHEQQRRTRLETAAQASRTATELANELYQRGLSDFLAVLDAQRAQYAAEDDLVQSQTAELTNAVALYKALGGGW